MEQCRRTRLRGHGCYWLLLGGLAACSAAPADPGVPAAFELVLLPTGRAVAWRTSPGVVYWETPRVLELTNSGDLAFPYVLESNVPWLSFSGAANGVVLGGQRARIELAIDATTCPSAGGEHLGVVSVLNAITFHRQASLDVACVVPGSGISAATDK